MKIALYIEDGLEQIVLTPDSDTERGILGKLHDNTRQLQIYRGSFYQCRGGWMRHEFGQYSGIYGGNKGDEKDSTMIVLRPTPKSNLPDKQPEGYAVPEPEPEPEPEYGA